MKKNIGKNTLGDGGKMSVQLRKFARSTHDLSYAWRNTQGVGTLVPFMHILGLPGDTFDIDLEAEVMTHPTVGPLFGSFKMQIDVFECPIRLYQSQLHNNALNIGLKMSEVKFPKLQFDTAKSIIPQSFSNSNILSYLGVRNIGYWNKNESGSQPAAINATKLLAYLDIFKNYYANKQEDNCYYLKPTYLTSFKERGAGEIKLPYTFTKQMDLDAVFNTKTEPSEIWVKASIIKDGKISIYTGTAEDPVFSVNGLNITTDNKIDYTVNNSNNNITIIEFRSEQLGLESYKLTKIDDLRESILKTKNWTSADIQDEYLNSLLKASTNATTFESNLTAELGGLFVKTYQSDLFNNWVNTEWVEGDNGINAITSIDTSGGSFNLDTLNLAKKVYNMLNRIAVSGGTYNDWIETVYTNDYVQRSEIPIYIGGMSKRIEFGQVVSTAGTEEEPLASLAGRGYTDQKKGGRMKFKCAEPCYVIGIVSITPYTDYYQGNSWDFDLDNLDELHKPQLDGIGWQDLTTDLMNADTIKWKNGVVERSSIGKTIAWANYMTAVNEVHGNFCKDESFMVLNREYGIDKSFNITGTSTYIDPAGYNYIFADTSRNAMNFWLQIGCGITARRKMSAKQIPIM